MRKSWTWGLLPFVVVLGCGQPGELGGPDGGAADGGASVARGTVSGQVLGTDLAPLEAASVTLTLGGSPEPRMASTDARGAFAFGGVPAGAQVLLTVGKAGHATLRTTTTVPAPSGASGPSGTSGTAPALEPGATVGPVQLARLDGTLRFTVLTPGGLPAAGARATLEASPTGALWQADPAAGATGLSRVVVDAVADAQGQLVFAGVPTPRELARLGGRYGLWVEALDANGDGVPETGGAATGYDAWELVTSATPRYVSLPFSRLGGAALSVESSNVASLRGASDLDPLRNMLRPDSPVFLWFNQPVQPGSLLARLTVEDGRELLQVTPTLTHGGLGATLSFQPGAVQEGREYNLEVRAVGAESGALFQRTGFFFGGDPAAPRSVALQELRYQETSNSAPTSNQLNPGEKVYVSFTVPVSRQPGVSGHVQAFFDVNIADASASSINVVGDVQGELGHPVGLDVFPDEPTAPLQTRTPAEQAVFPLVASGATTRYSFTYGGAFPLNPSSLRVQLGFSKLAPRGLGSAYETVWGQPLTTDLSAFSVAKQFPPTP